MVLDSVDTNSRQIAKDFLNGVNLVRLLILSAAKVRTVTITFLSFRTSKQMRQPSTFGRQP